MADDAHYFRLAASSRNTIDLCLDVEEESEDDDDLKPEHVCPFCLENFDLVGFCCHIDNGHPLEAESGICPICERRVGVNMAVHVITQHESMLKTMYKRKLRSRGSILFKNLEDEYEETFDEEPSRVVSSSDMTVDPLLSSFIYNPPTAEKPLVLEPSSTSEAKLAEKGLNDNILNRNIHLSPLSNKDQEEKAQRCEFVLELLYSTIFEEDKL